MATDRRGNIEVRTNDDGSLDEVVVYLPGTDTCIFHLEQMSDDLFWSRFQGDKEDLVLNFLARRGKVEAYRPIPGRPGHVEPYQKQGVLIDAAFEWEAPIVRGVADVPESD